MKGTIRHRQISFYNRKMMNKTHDTGRKKHGQAQYFASTETVASMNNVSKNIPSGKEY